MNDFEFYSIWTDALKAEDETCFISMKGHTSDTSFLATVYKVAHMSLRQICEASGLSQRAFAQRYCIPLRTVEDWCAGKRTPPDYIRLMIAESLGLIARSADSGSYHYFCGNCNTHFSHDLPERDANGFLNDIICPNCGDREIYTDDEAGSRMSVEALQAYEEDLT